MESKVLIRRIMNAIYQVDDIYRRISKDYGAKANELLLFYALSDEGDHSQKQVSEDWFIPKTTLNTIIKECEEKGYLYLETPAKGRERLIRMTDPGREYARELLRPVFEVEADALKLTAEKYGHEFIEALEYYADAFEKRYRGGKL